MSSVSGTTKCMQKDSRFFKVLLLLFSQHLTSDDRLLKTLWLEGCSSQCSSQARIRTRLTELTPTIGLATTSIIQANDTSPIVQPFFFASSSTRSMVVLSASLYFFSKTVPFPEDSRTVSVPNGRARLPAASGPQGMRPMPWARQ